jgi:hypothetical protein
MKNEYNKYYVVESRYCGPNPFNEENINCHFIEIFTSPALNIEDQVMTSGSISIQDTSIQAHGAFDAQEQAQAKIIELFGTNLREIEEKEECEYTDEDMEIRIGVNEQDKIYSMQVGKFSKLCEEGLSEVIGFELEKVAHDTTDKELRKIADDFELDLNEGYCMTSVDIYEYLEEERDEKIRMKKEEDEELEDNE